MSNGRASILCARLEALTGEVALIEPAPENEPHRSSSESIRI